jgi:hypothetical protein
MAGKKDPLTQAVSRTRKSHLKAAREIEAQLKQIQTRLSSELDKTTHEMKPGVVHHLVVCQGILIDKQEVLLRSLRHLSEEDGGELSAAFNVVVKYEDPQEGKGS